jgi:hypothetical protein
MTPKQAAGYPYNQPRIDREIGKRRSHPFLVCRFDLLVFRRDWIMSNEFFNLLKEVF